MAIITPYDGKIGVWLVHGRDVGEETIDDVAQTILTFSPAINAVWVKTSDGSDWMSTYDSKPALWIDGPAAVDKWVNTLQKYGLEFHAWCVPRGLDIQAETQKIIQVCQRPGVRSMVLDVEPYNGFWAGGKQTVRPYMLAIRSALPGSFHIGMSVDSRRNHYAEIFPDEWYPFVNSIHPQVYWPDFQNTPAQALTEAYAAWGNYKKPIFPALSGYGTPPEQITQARTLAVNTYKAEGLSYWVFGQIGMQEFTAINVSTENKIQVPPPGGEGSPVQLGTPIVVRTSSPQYQDGVYDPNRASFGTYQGPNGIGKYRPTDQGVANAYAYWDPQIRTSGWYRVEAYVAGRPALTGNARYKLHGLRDRPDDYLISVAQSAAPNGWATIGTYFIDAGRTDPGLVFLNDWTFEQGREVIFDAVRWTPVTAQTLAQVMLEVPYRSQEDPDARKFRNDCGPACVAMYVDFVRQRRGQPALNVPINDISAKSTLTNKDDGLLTRELIPLAAAYNVTLTLTSTLDVSAIIDEVRANRPPLCLVSYGPLLGRQNQADRSGHFVIVTGFDSDNVYVNDPDWWNQGGYNRLMGKNWKIPMTQFRNAIALSPVPKQGLKLVL